MNVTSQKILAGSKRDRYGLQGQNVYSLTVVAITDTATADSGDVLSKLVDDGSTPINYGIAYTWDGVTDEAARLAEMNPHQDPKQPTFWYVDLVYEVFPSLRERTIDPWTNSDSPLDRPPDIHVTLEPRQEAVRRCPLLGTVAMGSSAAPTAAGVNSDQQDIDPANLAAGSFPGRPVGNSFGDLLVSGFLRNRYRLVITYAINVAGYPWNLIDAYSESLNVDTWVYGDPLTWLCRNISADFVPQYGVASTNGFGYFRATAIFVYDPLGWWQDLLDEGVYEWTPSSGTPTGRQLISAGGQVMGKPSPLDGHGHHLDDATVQAGSFQAMRYLPFNKLNTFNDLLLSQQLEEFLNVDNQPTDLNAPSDSLLPPSDSDDPPF